LRDALNVGAMADFRCGLGELTPCEVENPSRLASTVGRADE